MVLDDLYRRQTCPGCGRSELLGGSLGDPPDLDAAPLRPGVCCVRCQVEAEPMTMQDRLGDDCPTHPLSPSTPADPLAAMAWRWYLRLGRDMNGDALTADARALLERPEMGFDASEREAYHDLFAVITGASREARAEEFEESRSRRGRH